MTLKPEVDKRRTTAVSTNSTSPTPTRIVEAQSWLMDANDNVVLTANSPIVTPHTSWQKSANCQ